MPPSSSRLVEVRYAVPLHRENNAWELTEETMPESILHGDAVDLLKALLTRWAAANATTMGDVLIARNVAVRWDEAHPKVGVDPDVCVLQPAPRDAQNVSSIRTWLPDHHPPVLAFEVVSESNPHKDYTLAPDKYAVSGTVELCVFDPLLAGPSSHGGPHRLQLWSRREDGALVRVYAGEGPAFSSVLRAWLVVVDEGRRLRIADDEAATRFWMTGEEHERAEKALERAEKERERAEKEHERAAKEHERAEKELALARIAELEAQLRSSH